ncbi:MAG: hypothetical protein ACFFAS_00340 [Promethearchaeota archaeon]
MPRKLRSCAFNKSAHDTSSSSSTSSQALTAPSKSPFLRRSVARSRNSSILSKGFVEMPLSGRRLHTCAKFR